jgi:hypothetical protein
MKMKLHSPSLQPRTTRDPHELKCLTALLRVEYSDLPRAVIYDVIDAVAGPATALKSRQFIIAKARETLRAFRASGDVAAT